MIFYCKHFYKSVNNITEFDYLGDINYKKCAEM